MTAVDVSSGSRGLGVASETRAAELTSEFDWNAGSLEPGIGVALSGGGFRAMLFHAGALARLNELGLLCRAKRISSVSGGSIAAGLLAVVWRELRPNSLGVFENFTSAYVHPLVAFARRSLDVKCALTGLLPRTSAAAQVAKKYDKYLYRGATLQDVPNTPRFVFCATNLQSGVLWRFSKPYSGDYVVGQIANPQFKLAQVVAASSAFPPVLSPMVLDVRAERFLDWPNQTRPIIPASGIDGYRKRVLLTDGGVYDNHGIEPVIKRYMTVFVSDGGAPFGRAPNIGWDWVRQLKRILDVTDNQVRALRRRDLVARFRLGYSEFVSGRIDGTDTRPYERFGAYWGIDTNPDYVSVDGALPCSAKTASDLARVSTRLADLGALTSKQLVNWGYAICDRCVRRYYAGPDVPLESPAAWPFGEAAL